MYVVVVRKLCMQFECPDVFFKRGEHSWQSTFPNSVTYSYYRDILIVFPNIHIRKTTNAATVNLLGWHGMRDMFRHIVEPWKYKKYAYKDFFVEIVYHSLKKYSSNWRRKKTSLFSRKFSSHSVEITEIYSHVFLAKISWKQRIYERNC